MKCKDRKKCNEISPNFQFHKESYLCSQSFTSQHIYCKSRQTELFYAFGDARRYKKYIFHGFGDARKYKKFLFRGFGDSRMYKKYSFRGFGDARKYKQFLFCGFGNSRRSNKYFFRALGNSRNAKKEIQLTPKHSRIVSHIVVSTLYSELF